MKALANYPISLIFIFTLFYSNPSEVKKDMVQFDRTFIPVHYYVSSGDMVKAKQAVFAMAFRWQQLQKDQASFPKDFSNRMHKIDRHLDMACSYIDGNKKMLALNQLRQVQYALMAIRHQYKIPYYLDHLYQFERSWTLINEIANDELLYLYEWQEFEDLISIAHTYGRKILQENPDQKIWKLSTKEQKLLQQYKNELSSALNETQKALKSAERKTVASYTAKVLPIYYNLRNQFGTFYESDSFFAMR